MGGSQEGKERQGPRLIPQIHGHLPEGLRDWPERLNTLKRTEGVDKTFSLFDALCHLSVSEGLKSTIHQLATLTEPYDVKCKVRYGVNYFFLRAAFFAFLAFLFFAIFCPPSHDDVAISEQCRRESTCTAFRLH